MPKARTCPNPRSELLANAAVGGVGISLPNEMRIPEDMGAVLLFVPLVDVAYKSPLDLQADLGLPWFVEGGDPMWFDEHFDDRGTYKQDQPPTLASLRGIAPNATGGLTAVEFINKLRSGGRDSTEPIEELFTDADMEIVRDALTRTILDFERYFFRDPSGAAELEYEDRILALRTALGKLGGRCLPRTELRVIFAKETGG